MEGVLPIFTLQNTFMPWSASATEEKQRCRGWLLGMSGLHHVPSPSNKGETDSGGRKGFLTWGNPSLYPMPG